MEGAKYKSVRVRVCESKFKLHSFYTQIIDQEVAVQVVKMLDSIYLWIGPSNQRKFNDLSLAMSNPYSQVPIATVLLGESTDETSKNLAIRLCKKLNKVVYVSLNVDEGRHVVPMIEKRIHEEIVQNSDYF